MFNPRRAARGPGLAIWLLLAEMLRVGFDRIPPVTLVTILGQVAIHLRDVIGLQRWLPSSIGAVCLSSLHVWYREDWKRLILAAVYHADDMHLYFNMVSMLWKGLKLERQLGSARFGAMIAAFAVIINGLLVLMGILGDHVTHDGSYITQCAVGFSGVLFALKVIANNIDPTGVQYVMGLFPVPTKYVCWAELVLIHIMVPNASFAGHLAGILVGLLYIYGPLKYPFDLIFGGTRSGRTQFVQFQGTTGYRSNSNNNNAQRTGYTGGPRWTGTGPTTQSYDAYTAGANEDEQLAQALDASLRDAPYGGANGGMPQYGGGASQYAGGVPQYGGIPQQQGRLYPDLSTNNNDVDELRRRRLQRFA